MQRRIALVPLSSTFGKHQYSLDCLKALNSRTGLMRNWATSGTSCGRHGSLVDWETGRKARILRSKCTFIGSLVCGGKKVVEPEGSCVKVIQDAFDRTHFILTQKLGQDKRLWQWGHLHRVHYQHALSKTPFKPFFHKSYASLGSRRNLNVAAYYVNEDYEFDGRHGANLRVVVDFGGDAFWSLDMVGVRLRIGQLSNQGKRTLWGSACSAPERRLRKNGASGREIMRN